MKNYFSILLGLLALTLLAACNNDQSYADRLNDERNSVNAFLADHNVVFEQVYAGAQGR